MPTISPRTLHICARLHPVAGDTPDLRVRFLESEQIIGPGGKKATTQIGVWRHDRFTCTINLYYLLRLEHNLLESIVLKTIVDNVELSTRSYTPYEIVENDHFLFSPIFSLKQTMGTIMLQITTLTGRRESGRSFSTVYCLQIDYNKRRGSPPINLGHNERRARWPSSMQESGLDYQGTDANYRIEVKHQREADSGIDLLDGISTPPKQWRGDPNTNASQHYSIISTPSSGSHRIGLKERVQDSPASVMQAERHKGMTSKTLHSIDLSQTSTSRRKSGSVSLHQHCDTVTNGRGEGRTSASSSFDRMLLRDRQAPDNDSDKITSRSQSLTFEDTSSSTLAETIEDLELKKQCEVEEARAASLRRKRLLMAAQRKAMEEEILAEEEEAAFNKLKQELSLKRKMTARE